MEAYDEHLHVAQLDHPQQYSNPIDPNPRGFCEKDWNYSGSFHNGLLLLPLATGSCSQHVLVHTLGVPEVQ